MLCALESNIGRRRDLSALEVEENIHAVTLAMNERDKETKLLPFNLTYRIAHVC